MKLTLLEFKCYSIISKNGLITAFIVSDDRSTVDNRPTLVSFPVSILYPADMQKQRAQAYAKFMNKINEATVTAYEQNSLIDILKA